MNGQIKLEEKYERHNWPAIPRPDRKAPPGWSLSLITAVDRVRNHALSPDGEQLAFIWDRADLSDVYTMPASGGGWPQRRSTDRALVSYWADELPQWSPDGRWLAFTAHGHVHVVPLEGGLPQKISDFAPEAFAPAWLPDSAGMVVSVERQECTQLLLTSRDGAWPRPLFTGPGDGWDARPSPDGQHLLFTRRPHDDLNRLDLCLLSLESGHLATLAGRPKERNWSGRWSPDGQSVAFLSQRGGWNDLWLVRPDGEGLRQLTRLGHDVGDIAWSPDGRHIAGTLNRDGAFDLVLVDVETGQVRDLRAGAGFHSRPSWSPAGDFLTFEYESPTQPPDLYRLELESGRLVQLTFSNLPALAANSLVVPERLRYRSFDGLEIPAFLYRPEKPNGAAILHPHGGPSSLYTFEWDILAQYFVAKGYTYLAPNYRGSTGYGVPFEQANYGDWGGGDTQDCLYGARTLRQMPGIDGERLGIYGGSYGGYMTACCLSRDPDTLFACGVSKYGDANVVSSWAQCNRDLRLYTEIFLGHPAQNRQVYRAASPIHQVDNVQKPVLILHGLLDTVVPPQASEEWVEALRRAGKTFEYKTYANEAHGFLHRRTQLDAYSRIERFFDWYLMP